MNKNQTELNSLNVKTKVIQKSVGEIEEGMEFANFQIEELKKKDEENADKIKKLEDQLLYQEVYSRRENMRFFGIPEATQGHEDTGEVIHKFIRDELNIDGPGSIEFQRVHWLGKRINGQSRPIIVHFLKLPEHELVFRSVRELGEDTDVKREKEEAMAKNEKGEGRRENGQVYFS
ncbi:transposition, RNA-mediated [Desmophyllum pertusum]|uniref:Transposition, RNA-mediated n=1 Tax=Desmophyllum pertusum TaxID=174260 RepID=A0A9W9ZD44_9CNID|nr:transposition, RNA-mediated [Desmophyllum pertusum]